MAVTPSKPLTTSGSEKLYTVQEGDAGFWGIAQKVYGHGKYHTLIAKANPNADPLRLRPGQKLVIPGASSIREVAPAGDAGPPPNPGEVSIIWPLAGRGRGSVTSGFGYREDPITGGRKFHKGVDIDGAREERVLSAAAGEVVYSGRMGGFGTVVMLDHGSRLLTVYAHLSRSNVKLEERVARGQTIGYVGSSGRTNGTHLHFEVRYRGVSVDPLDYLP